MAKQTIVADPKQELELIRLLTSPEFADDPEAYAIFAYPWGKKNTPLANFKGPRGWQRECMQEIKHHIRNNRERMVIDLPPEVYLEATSSGRGPGKSALAAQLTGWMESCHLGATTIITANTEAQLRSRTMAELGKWHTLAINKHWFEKTAMGLRPAEWLEEALKRDLKIDTGYYYAQAQLWSEEVPDAFAGVHNPLGLMVMFDEASGIPEPIWTVTEGFFTEPSLHRYWLNFSNPRRNTGAFFECFHKHRNLWRHKNIDSRTVEGTDPATYQRIIDKYGADSDEARVEVYGQFPKVGDRQFIARELAELCAERDLVKDEGAPLIMAVDVARFGSDKSVIGWRQGRDARSIPFREFKGLDNMQLAYEVIRAIDETGPDAVCIDAGGGSGVIDRVRELGYKVHEVWFGSVCDEPEWADMRTAMWARLRDWLPGGMMPKDIELIDDLAGPEYTYVASGDKRRLESKDSMKGRGLASPDKGDALALTFAVKPARRDGANRAVRRRIADGAGAEVFEQAQRKGPQYTTATTTRDWMKHGKNRKRLATGVDSDV